jgi:hypothetical protein
MARVARPSRTRPCDARFRDQSRVVRPPVFRRVQAHARASKGHLGTSVLARGRGLRGGHDIEQPRRGVRARRGSRRGGCGRCRRRRKRRAHEHGRGGHRWWRRGGGLVGRDAGKRLPLFDGLRLTGLRSDHGLLRRLREGRRLQSVLPDRKRLHSPRAVLRLRFGHQLHRQPRRQKMSLLISEVRMRASLRLLDLPRQAGVRSANASLRMRRRRRLQVGWPSALRCRDGAVRRVLVQRRLHGPRLRRLRPRFPLVRLVHRRCRLRPCVARSQMQRGHLPLPHRRGMHHEPSRTALRPF